MATALLETVSVAGLTPVQAIGIPLAIVGAMFMSLGALYQHRGVMKVELASGAGASHGLSLGHLRRLLTRPSWVVGTLMLGLAIVCQLGSLAFAPLIVVQPLGVVSLVMTTIITSRLTRIRLSRIKRIAVGLCVLGVAGFVTVAAIYATQEPITTGQIVAVLVVLAIVVAAFGAAFVAFRRRFKGIFYILGAGIIYGFVATLAKITINRIQHGSVEALTILCVIALLLGTAVGAYFVQTAYASGPPDLVVAGLTVIDPLVAVAIGIAILGEVRGAPGLAAVLFLLFGLVAVAGVVLLERGQTRAEIEAAKRHALGRAADAGR